MILLIIEENGVGLRNQITIILLEYDLVIVWR